VAGGSLGLGAAARFMHGNPTHRVVRWRQPLTIQFSDIPLPLS
jgi:hypothetical protein